MKIKPTAFWYIFCAGLPFLSAWNAAFHTYYYADGHFQQAPVDVENILAGFVAGIILSGLLLGVTFAVRALARRNARNKAHPRH